MALKTLKGLKTIGGFPVYQDDEIADGKWSDVDPKYHICIHHGDNTVSIRLQDGPIKENGVNGCQVDTVIELSNIIIIRQLNLKFPCSFNERAADHLEQALMCLADRKKDREKRGVEGKSKV